MLQEPARNRVTCLVVSNDLFLLRRDNFILLLKTTDYSINRILEILHIDRFLVLTSRDQSRFVTNVRNFCPRKTWSLCRKFLRIHFLRQFQWLQVHIKDLLTTNQVRLINRNLTVKTSWTQ